MNGGSIDASTPALFDAVRARFGRLEILVNNAACDPGAISLLDVTPVAADYLRDVNLKAVFFCSQHGARVMLRQNSGGRIVNIGSRGQVCTVDGGLSCRLAR